MYFIGLDIGSTSSKAVLIDKNREILDYSLVSLGTGSTGPDLVLRDVLTSIEDEEYSILVTGYGRNYYDNAEFSVSELSCHAAGVGFLNPDTRTVIDIGGQDIKVLSLDEKGKMFNFIMNDKCAAGTGRFLDVMAGILEIATSDISDFAHNSGNPISISSTCTVFAESEVISYLSKGRDKYDICYGINESVAKRVAGMVKRTDMKERIAITGGVANNENLVRIIEKEIKRNIGISPMAQYTGALGAALICSDRKGRG